MYSIETIILVGNPVVNTCPDIGRIENNQDALRNALDKYFGGGSSS